jgi:hypothetical protein
LSLKFGEVVSMIRKHSRLSWSKEYSLPLAVICLFVCNSSARADLIAYWNFNSLTTTAGVPSNANQTNYAPSAGAGSLDLVGWSSRAGATAPHGISNFTGTTTNALFGDPALQSLALQASNAATGTPNNGASLVIQANLAAFIDPVLSFATQRSTTGFNSNQVAWSTDGVNFTDFGVPYNPATTFGLQLFDFTAINALDRAATAFFRITFNGATSNSGNNRLDNIQINAVAVPEPGTLAFVGTIGLLGLAVGRRKWAFRFA